MIFYLKERGHALKIKSDYIDAYFDLGQILITIGKFEAAIKNFQKVDRGKCIP